jgi:hypothetical protein
MIRRDTERNHDYANEVFSHFKIYEIQGILKEGDDYKCGIEAYQVESFSYVNFEKLNNQEEHARYLFCSQMGVPYKVIITAEDSGEYRIYNSSNSNGIIRFELEDSLSKIQFVEWWRGLQTFDQKKPMYNAKARIANSIIDEDLFSNSLAWGVNVDGFSIDFESRRITSIFEKRICSYKPPYTVESYDPNRFFHGTRNRSGDYPSWKILFDLASNNNVPLCLLTFDTSTRENVGAANIINVGEGTGLTYKEGISPKDNIFNNDLGLLKNWFKENIRP